MFFLCSRLFHRRGIFSGDVGADMSSGLIMIVGLIYAYCSYDLLSRGQTALAIAFAGYAFSNIGLYLAAK